jgi:hypothetical protein
MCIAVMPNFRNKVFIAIKFTEDDIDKLMPKQCEDVSIEKIKEYAEISGIEYSCNTSAGKYIFFVSDDKYFLSFCFLDRDNQELVNQYEALFNSIKRK